MLSYLDGEVDTIASIDKNAPLEIAMQRPLPYVKSSSAAAQATSIPTMSSLLPSASIAPPVPLPHRHRDDSETQDVEMADSTAHADQSATAMDTGVSEPLGGSGAQGDALKEKIIDRLQKKFDQAQRPITENITQLSDQLTLEKIAAIKAKKKAQQRKQVTAGVDLDDDLMSGPGATGVLSAHAALTGLGAINLTSEQLKNNELIMKQIKASEIIAKDRFNVLQSSGKHFEKGNFSLIS